VSASLRDEKTSEDMTEKLPISNITGRITSYRNKCPKYVKRAEEIIGKKTILNYEEEGILEDL
jgi:hypothetical protein